MKAYASYNYLEARARAVPIQKVYAYDEVKSNDNLTLQLYSIPSFRWGNEAEILTIVILRENKFFCHFKGEEIFGNILGERNFSKTLGDVSRGKILNF